MRASKLFVPTLAAAGLSLLAVATPVTVDATHMTFAVKSALARGHHGADERAGHKYGEDAQDPSSVERGRRHNGHEGAGHR